MLAMALFISGPLPTGAWILAGVCAVTFAWVVKAQRKSEKRIADYQKRRNERASAILEQVLIGKNPSWPYFVYLRPFNIDGKFIEAPRQRADDAFVEEYGLPTAYHDLESALALLVYPHSQFVALSDDPGKAGAGYVRSTDLSWKEEVRALCEHAEGIFVVPFNFEGTAWEVEMVIKSNWLLKTFFVMPAHASLHRLPGFRRLSLDYRDKWEKGRARYGMLKLPEYDEQGAVVLFGDRMRVFRGFGRKSLRIANKKRTDSDLNALRSILTELSAANKSY
ncbi:MAG: hypothetical protein PVF37_11275 [Desulfobacterales bacterium]